MIDISWLPSIALEIVVCLIFLFAILTGFKDGIFKKLYNLACFVILLLLLWFAVPPVAKALEGTGWIVNLVNQVPENIRGFIEGVLSPTVYSFLAGLIILIGFGIVQMILGLILNKLLKNKGIISRTLGGLYGFVSAFIGSSILLVCVASPTLFGEVGTNKINETTVTKIVYQGTQGMQNVLKKLDLPYDLESVGARALAGENASKEDRERYASTISRLPSLKDELSNVLSTGTIDTNKYLNEDGTIKQDSASLLVDDTIVIVDLVNQMPTEQKDQIKTVAENALTQVRDEILVGGTPKETIKVTQEQKDSLQEKLTTLGLDSSLINDLNNCLEVEA